MKRFLFAIIAIFAVVSSRGATVITSFRDPNATITYQSVDAENNPITLSAKLYWTSNNTIKFVTINCHATITDDASCPTGSQPQMDVIKYMTTEDALVVCPDYIGFGESNGKTHPYMCATLTGRNVLDAYKAAIKHVKEQDKNIASTYYTINVGYSQGGATALAFQRYLETEATDADRKLVNLRGSVCGAGPYNQQIVFDEYEKGEGAFATLDYPIYLFYVLNGHYETFRETTMRKITLEECFTPEFWSYYNSTFKAAFEAKETNVDDLNTMLKNAGFNTFSSIINADYKVEGSKVRRTIRKALAQSNLLADGWTPKTNIIFYHDKAGNDKVVPYACTQAATNRFAGHCSYVDAVDDYDYDVAFRLGIATLDKDNYLWHAAVFREIWKSDLKYPLQVAIITGASITSNVSYNFNQLDHRTFGARFYAQFLAERACMRPAATSTSGTAHNTNIDPVETTTEKTVTADEVSAVGTYDRVTTSLTYDLPQGEPVFVQFASKVDGLYFGHDAPRYKVELNEAGEAIGYTEMNYLDDFEAGEVYLLSAIDEGENHIISMTAGATMKTVDSPLAWRELNMRNARKPRHLTEGTPLSDCMYISNYMPFAYTTPSGVTAYAMTPTAEENKLWARAFTGVIPAGTGTLIETEPNTTADAKLFVLRPDIEKQGGDNIKNNILSGTYTRIQNDKNNFYHYGISTENNLGYWIFPNKDYVAAYSSYIDPAIGPAKGFLIGFGDDDVTAIEGIKTEGQLSVWGTDGSARSAMQKGINIVRMSDGTVKKVMVK